MELMGHMGTVNLLKLPLVDMKGEMTYISDEGYVVFPQIIQRREISLPVLHENFVEGFVLNNKYFFVVKRLSFYDVVYETTIRTFYSFAGVVVFGDTIFCFVDGNKCLVINTNTDETKTVIINQPSNIVHVYQISAYLFAVITTSPTTVYIYSMDDAGNIATANDLDNITLPSYSYGVFANPKVNPRLVKKDNLFYLIGEDATVVLSLQISDLLYLRTEATFLQKVSPFPEFEEQGLEFITETQNFLLFRNSLFNSFTWISKGDRRIYFSTNYIYLSQQHVVYDRNLYTLHDIIDPAYTNIPLYKEFTVRFKSGGLNGITIEIVETINDEWGYMSVLSRFLDFENYFNYTIKATQTHYRLALRGEEFVITLYTDKVCRIRGYQAW